MRSLLAAATLVSALAASPAAAQSWLGALPQAPGEPRTLTFEVSPLDEVMGWELFIAYAPDFFEAPNFASSASSTVTIGFSDPEPPFGFSSPGPVQAANFGSPVPPGYQQVVVFGNFFTPTTLFGPLASANFVAKPGAAGDTSLLSRFTYSLDSDADVSPIDLAPLATTIAAVPEPQTWMTMLAALGLLAAASLRRARA